VEVGAFGLTRIRVSRMAADTIDRSGTCRVNPTGGVNVGEIILSTVTIRYSERLDTVT